MERLKLDIVHEFRSPQFGKLVELANDGKYVFDRDFGRGEKVNLAFTKRVLSGLLTRVYIAHCIHYKGTAFFVDSEYSLWILGFYRWHTRIDIFHAERIPGQINCYCDFECEEEQREQYYKYIIKNVVERFGHHKLVKEMRNKWSWIGENE